MTSNPPPFWSPSSMQSLIPLHSTWWQKKSVPFFWTCSYHFCTSLNFLDPVHTFNTKVCWKFWESDPEVKLQNPLIQPNLETDLSFQFLTKSCEWRGRLDVDRKNCAWGMRGRTFIFPSCKIYGFGESTLSPSTSEGEIGMEESTWPMLNSSMPNFTSSVQLLPKIDPQ